MKVILSSILLLACFAVEAQPLPQQRVIYGRGVRQQAAIPVETAFFGNINISGSSYYAFPGSYTFQSNGSANLKFVCPGSGSRTLVELSAYVKLVSGTPHIRLAVYDSSYNLVAQGSAEFTPSSATGAWEGHTAFSGTTTLTGGAEYFFAMTSDGAGVSILKVDDLNVSDYSAGDQTGGFSASFNAATVSPYRFFWRIGVQ